MTTPSPANDEVRVLDYLLVLARFSRKIIYTSIIVAVSTYLVLLLLVPVQFTATARLVPPTQNVTLTAQLMDGMLGTIMPGRGGGGLGELASGFLGLKSPAAMYVGILNSDTIYDRIIERFELRKQYGKKYIEEVRKKLASRADIKATRDGLITISVNDEDRQKAAAMANAFVEELAALLRRVSEEEAASRLAFLDRKMQEASVNLTKAEERLRQFSEQSGVLQIDAQTKGTLQYIATLRAAIDAKEVEMQVVRQFAMPSNYYVIRLETELNALKDKMREAETREAASPLSEPFIATGRVPALGLEYLRLLREAKFQDAVYRVYLRLAEMARVDQAREPVVLQVIDHAKPPERKSFPQRLIITVIVFLVTLMGMTLSVLFRESWVKRATPAATQQVQQLRAHLAWVKEDGRRLLFFRKKKDEA